MPRGFATALTLMYSLKSLGLEDDEAGKSYWGNFPKEPGGLVGFFVLDSKEGSDLFECWTLSFTYELFHKKSTFGYHLGTCIMKLLIIHL